MRDTSFARSAMAGAAAACSATIVFHPIDTVKVVLQRGASTPTSIVQSTKLTSAHIVWSIGGFSRLSVGVVPASVSMAAACAVRMGVYEVTKEKLIGDGTRAPLLPFSTSGLIALSSGFSVVVSSMVRSPLDMIKTQMQSGTASGMVAGVTSAYASSGIVGLYRGAGLALMRDVPFFSINLSLYEFTRGIVEERKQTSHVSFLQTTLIGGVVQGIAGFTTNPIDVLKTRVQSGRAENMIDAIQTVLKEGAVRGFMRGALYRTMWIAPQGSVYYPIYELVQNWTSNDNGTR